MGRVAEFLSWALNNNSSEQPPEVKGDPGGGAIYTAEHYAPAGFDSQPSKGDFFATFSGPGTGDEIVSGYHDPNRNNRKAGAGEARTYARDASGAVACEVYCRANGTIEIKSIAGGSKLNLNGVEIDQNGNITTPGNVLATGEVTAKDGAASVSLSTHLHNSAMGPTSGPTPGT